MGRMPDMNKANAHGADKQKFNIPNLTISKTQNSVCFSFHIEATEPLMAACAKKMINSIDSYQNNLFITPFNKLKALKKSPENRSKTQKRNKSPPLNREF